MKHKNYTSRTEIKGAGQRREYINAGKSGHLHSVDDKETAHKQGSGTASGGKTRGVKDLNRLLNAENAWEGFLLAKAH